MTVIIETRFGGVYEGGPWAAFGCEPEGLPDDAFAGDPFCAGWWDEPTVPVGVGDSPNEALARLANLRTLANVALFQAGDLITTAPCTPDDWPKSCRGRVRAVESPDVSTHVLRPSFNYSVEFDGGTVFSIPERYLRTTASIEGPKRRWFRRQLAR